jgi:hypothetical protein
LIDAVRPIVGEEEREIIGVDGRGKNPEAAEKVFARDCPLCGVVSVNRIRFPVLAIGTPSLWSLDIADLETSGKPTPKKQGWFNR